MATADSLTCRTEKLNRDMPCHDCGGNIPRGNKMRFVSGSLDDEYKSFRFHGECYPEPAIIQGVPIKTVDR